MTRCCFYTTYCDYSWILFVTTGLQFTKGFFYKVTKTLGSMVTGQSGQQATRILSFLIADYFLAAFLY